MVVRRIIHGSLEYQRMVNLRYVLLRAPLGLSFAPEELAEEREEILLGAFEEDKLVGCCILLPLNKNSLRLRQMAVHQEKQGKGIGREIVVFAERLAFELGYTNLLLHARDEATGFYEKLGYQVQGDGFEEVGILHYAMRKRVE